jgi:GNAT superfamily N-acetyltransferase
MDRIDLPVAQSLPRTDAADLPKPIGKVLGYSVYVTRDEVLVLDQTRRAWAGSYPTVMSVSCDQTRRAGISFRVMDYARLHHAYRGLGIAPLVYCLVAHKVGPIMSGTAQSVGGRALWNSIAKRARRSGRTVLALWKGEFHEVEAGNWGEVESDVDTYNTIARLVAV